MTQAVLFDFGGVFTASPFETLHEATAEMGVDPEVTLDIVFGPYDRDTDHPWHQLERGQMTMEEYGTRARADLAAVGIEMDPFEVLRRMGSGGVIREDVVGHVRRVREAGHPTALVTNNIAEIRELWQALIPVDELFGAVIDSSEVGVRKPDPKIFELALDAIGGVDPSDTVFLDDYHGNITAAEKLGMTGILVESDYRPAFTALDDLLN